MYACVNEFDCTCVSLQQFNAPSIDDKLMEVVAITGANIATTKVFKFQFSNHRIAQVSLATAGAGWASVQYKVFGMGLCSVQSVWDGLLFSTKCLGWACVQCQVFVCMSSWSVTVVLRLVLMVPYLGALQSLAC